MAQGWRGEGLQVFWNKLWRVHDSLKGILLVDGRCVCHRPAETTHNGLSLRNFSWHSPSAQNYPERLGLNPSFVYQLWASHLSFLVLVSSSVMRDDSHSHQLIELLWRLIELAWMTKSGGCTLLLLAIFMSSKIWVRRNSPAAASLTGPP